MIEIGPNLKDVIVGIAILAAMCFGVYLIFRS